MLHESTNTAIILVQSNTVITLHHWTDSIKQNACIQNLSNTIIKHNYPTNPMLLSHFVQLLYHPPSLFHTDTLLNEADRYLNEHGNY